MENKELIERYRTAVLKNIICAITFIIMSFMVTIIKFNIFGLIGFIIFIFILFEAYKEYNNI